METRKIKIIIIFTSIFFFLAGTFTYLMFFSGGRSDSQDGLKSNDSANNADLYGEEIEVVPELEGNSSDDSAIQFPPATPDSMVQPEIEMDNLPEDSAPQSPSESRDSSDEIEVVP